MGKKLDKKVESESDSMEEYDQEDDDSQEQYEGSSGDEGEREIDRQHVLNYESDDSSDDQNDSDDSLSRGLSKQKQELQGGETWGSKKKNFYGRDKKQDDATSSEDDEDERIEAIRLQKVRAQKLQMMARDKELESVNVIEQKAIVEQSSDEEDSDDSSNLLLTKSKKLGDKLFAEDKNNSSQQIENMRQVISQLQKPELARKIIDKESPELQGLMEEFRNTLEALNIIRPILEKANKEIRTKHKNAINYLEMKHNLLLSYCTFLSFYLLLKIDGTPVKEHPVIFKLAHIKNLLDGLNEIDERVQQQVKRLIRKTQIKEKILTKKQKQVEESDEDMEIDDEEHLNKKVKKSKKLNDSDEDLAGHSDEPELDMYDDEIDESAYGSEDDDMEDAVMSREQEKANKKLQKKELKNKLNNLDDIDDISSLIKKKPKKETEQPIKKIDKEDKELNDDMMDTTANKKDSKKSKKEEEEVPKKKRMNFNDIQVTKDVEGDEVYQLQKDKIKEKKALKKEKKMEAKVQTLKEVERMEKDINRNISYDIMKAKGLTRKRKKIDRNSRVKFREKYRKAQIKRGSKVQEYKAGPKGVYGGEASGLRSGIIKSTALT